jgi:hypothetical protein
MGCLTFTLSNRKALGVYLVQRLFWEEVTFVIAIAATKCNSFQPESAL